MSYVGTNQYRRWHYLLAECVQTVDIRARFIGWVKPRYEVVLANGSWDCFRKKKWICTASCWNPRIYWIPHDTSIVAVDFSAVNNLSSIDFPLPLNYLVLQVWCCPCGSIAFRVWCFAVIIDVAGHVRRTGGCISLAALRRATGLRRRQVHTATDQHDKKHNSKHSGWTQFPDGCKSWLSQDGCNDQNNIADGEAVFLLNALVELAVAWLCIRKKCDLAKS